MDLFLEDEGQQYGNMEEAASVARTPAKCLEVWSGFFLLEAAWVDPGRNALQSAEQRC